MNERDKLADAIEHARSGDTEAYRVLYERTIQDVYRNTHFLIEQKDDVDDVVQEIYIQVYKSLAKYDRERPFKPWVMGIAIKQIHAYRRKRWMSLRILKKAEAFKNTTEQDFSDDIVDKISNQHLLSLVNKLPYKLKQVVVLRYLNDHSQEEVARILDIPLGTVKSRIHSALKKLNGNQKNKQLFLEKARNL